MVPNTPYSPQLEGRDPLTSMRETIPAFGALVAGWSSADFDRPWAPGKWTARQVLVHLAQTELALGARSRMALTTTNFAAPSFDQDLWLARESFMSGPDAVAAFTAIASMNLALYASLSDADRQVTLIHSEYGPMTVDWIIYQEAGHQRHHLTQLQALAR
jgi:hypothetical protein